jgi:hypothetical protein
LLEFRKVDSLVISDCKKVNQYTVWQKNSSNQITEISNQT